MKFPIMAYRCPGQHKAGHNQTYDYMNILDQESHDRAVKNGWKLSLEEAKGIYELEKITKPKQKSEYRLKLEAMAQKIPSIKFNSKTTDDALYKKLQDATKEK